MTDNSQQPSPTPSQNPQDGANSDWVKATLKILFSKGGLFTLLFVVGAVVGRLGLTSFLRDQKLLSVPTVRVISPQPRSLDRTLQLPGNIEAIEQASLYAHVSGYLKKIFVDEGDKVKKDQVLAIIDAPDIIEEYNKRKAELHLKEVTLQRYKELITERVISQQEYDTEEADEAEAKARFENAAANMEFTRIKAPFSGSIARRYKYPGDLITAATKGDQTPLFLLVNESTLRVALNVPQIDSASIKLDYPVDIVLDAYPKIKFHGKVSRIDALLDETTKTQRVLVDLPNDENMLRAGMFATAVLHFEHKDDALTLPNDVIETQSGNESVYVYRDGMVKRVPIKTGLRTNDYVEIVEGVSPSDQVVKKGIVALTDGMKVNSFKEPQDTVQKKDDGIPSRNKANEEKQIARDNNSMNGN